MEISFVGHACFRLRGREASAVIDPYGKGLGLLCVNMDKTPKEARILARSSSAPGLHVFQRGGMEGPLALRLGVMSLPDMLLLDRDGNWQYVNDYFAALYDKKRSWFPCKNLFQQFPEMKDEWHDIVRTVADTRETYIDRGFRGLPHLPKKKSAHWIWNVLVFPIKLHDDRDGVVLSARLIEKKQR